MLVKLCLCCNVWLLDVGETGCPDFILLILRDIRQAHLFAHFMLVVDNSLLNGRESWLRVLAELTVDVWAVALDRLILLALLLEILVQ